jgi:N-dimethylarginine dimethylaminohydrolase
MRDRTNSGYVCNSTGVLKKVLLSQPEYVRLQPINVIAKKWITEGKQIDVSACLREHDAFVKTYRENGVEVHLVPAKEGLTNQVFARDFGACIREGYIRGRYREPVRWAETEVYDDALQKLGIPCAAVCEEGIFEGGDFWFLDDETLAVGLVARTDEAGFASLERQLTPLGYRMIRVPCENSNLHLDMCFNIVAERTAVICEGALPDSFINILKERKFDLIPVTQEEVYLHHCNLQCMGGGRVISFTANKDVNQKLQTLGLKVIEVELTEILKMGGGPHCMTFPLVRERESK